MNAQICDYVISTGYNYHTLSGFLDSLDDIRGVLKALETTVFFSYERAVLHFLPSFTFWREDPFQDLQDFTAYFMVLFHWFSLLHYNIISFYAASGYICSEDYY